MSYIRMTQFDYFDKFYSFIGSVEKKIANVYIVSNCYSLPIQWSFSKP